MAFVTKSGTFNPVVPMSDIANGTNTRRDRRIPVTLPVEWEAGTGLTRDVSASGVFFETTAELPVGEPIQFALVMEHVDPHGPLRLRCEGRIVRVERRGSQGWGLGVAIVSQWLEPAGGHNRAS